MVTERCGKRAKIDSIAARLLRRHIEAIVLPCTFHGTINGATRAGNFFRRDPTHSADKRPGLSPGIERTTFPQSPPPPPPAPPPLEPWSARSQVRSCG